MNYLWDKYLSVLMIMKAFIFIIILIMLPAKSLQSCPTLCDPMDCSLPRFSVHGILQARTLEWVAISFSNAWRWKVKVNSLSRVWLLATPGLQPTRLLHTWDFLGNNTGVGCHCLLPWQTQTVYQKALLTKVCVVKVMVFPVVLYGYESWTINKAE